MENALLNLQQGLWVTDNVSNDALASLRRTWMVNIRVPKLAGDRQLLETGGFKS